MWKEHHERQIRRHSTKYFESLGFNVRDRDFDGRKKGTDFFIELDDRQIRQRVERIQHRRFFSQSH